MKYNEYIVINLKKKQFYIKEISKRHFYLNKCIIFGVVLSKPKKIFPELFVLSN